MRNEEFDNTLMAAINLYAEAFGYNNLITVRRISHFEKAFLNYYNKPCSANDFLEGVKNEIETGKNRNIPTPASQNDKIFLTEPVMLHMLDDDYHITNSVRMASAADALTAGFFTVTGVLPEKVLLNRFIIPWFIGIGYKQMIICLK